MSDYTNLQTLAVIEIDKKVTTLIELSNEIDIPAPQSTKEDERVACKNHLHDLSDQRLQLVHDLKKWTSVLMEDMTRRI